MEEVGREATSGRRLFVLDAAHPDDIPAALPEAGPYFVCLLKVIDAPARWPAEEQLREAKERMRRGDRMTAEEFRHAQLDE